LDHVDRIDTISRRSRGLSIRDRSGFLTLFVQFAGAALGAAAYLGDLYLGFAVADLLYVRLQRGSAIADQSSRVDSNSLAIASTFALLLDTRP
jgi:hypothetical protein